jgi:DNA invertase Pin-like site-specific DNA recombinase
VAATEVSVLVGYARVSTADQKLDRQLDALREAGCERIFEDVASGAKAERPGLDRMLDTLREGDVVVIMKLSRLGRSLRHLVELVDDFRERGVGFRSLTEGFDTTTAGGRFVFSVMAAMAEFEREIIVERTRSGLAAARARGRVGGRKPVMTPRTVRMAAALMADRRNTVGEIADELGVSRRTLYRYVRPDGTLTERGTRLAVSP